MHDRMLQFAGKALLTVVALCQVSEFHDKATVPLNFNFILPCLISRGTTTILQCIPVTCLHGPHLLMSCNIHILWKYTHESTHLVEAHA